MKTYSRAKLLFGVAGLGAAAWLPQGAAVAQEEQQQQNTQAAGAVQEIVVTARRREENLQDVPLAISAVGGEELTQRGVEQVQNLNAQIPNLSIGGGGATGESQASFRVRGMPGVAVYVDGVAQPTTDGLFTASVVEVDRIEVLRGPQGTLFGNASLGGAVQYVTRPPGDTFGARLQATTGAFNRRDFQAAVDLPLHETLKFKITAASLYREGFMRSVVIDRSYGDVNDELIRADLLWEPIESLSVRYNVEESDTDRAGPARSVWNIGPANAFTVNGRTLNTNAQVQAYINAFGINYSNERNASGWPNGQLGEHETRINWRSNGLVIDLLRHTLDIGYDITDNFRVRSISGYRELTRSVQTDFDGDAQVFLSERDFRTRRYDFSQELQLLGSFGEGIDWVLGGFYQENYYRDRTVTWALPEFTCDIWSGPNRAARGVTAIDETNCLNNRARALGVARNMGETDAQFRQRIGGATVNNLGVTPSTFTGLVPTNTDNMTIHRDETTAFFGDLTWRATDKLTVAAGLRYSRDESPGTTIVTGNALGSRAPMFPDIPFPNFYGYNADLLPAPVNPTEFSATTKRLTLQYSWTPDIMTYIGYADGYGPGGASQPPASVLQLNAQGQAVGGYMRDIFNQGRSDVPGATLRDEQTVDNYEIGLRADWFNRTLRTNVTAFFTDWQNVPVSRYVATTWWDIDGNGFAEQQIDANQDGRPDIYFFPSLVTVAASKAEARGVELESMWLPLDGLQLGLNVGWLDTEYTELGDAGLGVVPAVSGSGTRFAGAPELTLNTSVSYSFGLPNGATLTPRADYTWTDEFTLETLEANQTVQEAYGLLNARVTYDSGQRWQISLSGTNLTDEYYFNSGFYTTSQQIAFNTLGRPREWALTFNYAFE